MQPVKYVQPLFSSKGHNLSGDTLLSYVNLNWSCGELFMDVDQHIVFQR